MDALKQAQLAHFQKQEKHRQQVAQKAAVAVKGATPSAAVALPTPPTRPPLGRNVIPASKHMFTIVNFLKEHRMPMTAQQLKARLLIEVEKNQELLDMLNANTRIRFDPSSLAYEYKPPFDVFDRASMRDLLSGKTEGFLKKDLEESYDGAKHDLSVLIQSGELYSIKNTEAGAGDTIFCNRIPALKKVDDKFLSLWSSVRLSDKMSDMDVAEELVKMGKKPMDQEEGPKVDDDRKRKQRKARAIKLTNTHISHIDLQAAVPAEARLSKKLKQ
eukprot:TRINITY_DN13949_c0_g1_i1.p1 TRINITY_DN13949_c0_g1~~TRINITY_DN13949_c0_g1_i1.p1  ORF type:complete len:282 (+),score=34.78 TRINITY_DN13949_c0_g1_i1:29-847(+)